LPLTGEGIVIDIGTGDGRFVSAAARANPNKFFIGVDANTKPLEKPSMKATRKPAKGGLPNAMFVQAAVEDLPEEFDGVADEIHIHFPWGSLLKAVATGDEAVLRSLRRIAAPGCLLEVVIGIDPDRDQTEIERLGLPELTLVILHSFLIPKYTSAGFEFLECRDLDAGEWSGIETSWAKRLSTGTTRRVVLIKFSVPSS
jgi:16S rRNA (adenine(1408)-N(1))-methyltransferase